MTGLIVAVSIAALAGTPHCIGMCGGFATAATEGGSLPYHLGRVGVYATLGALAGTFGRWIPGPSWLASAVSAALIIGMSLSLAGFLPEPRVHVPGLSRIAAWVRGRSGPAASLVLGILNGLLPCGLLYATLAFPVASGSAISGALLMALFGFWTAFPLTLAATGLRGLLRTPRARVAVALVVLISGLAGLAVRSPAAQTSDVPSCHKQE